MVLGKAFGGRAFVDLMGVFVIGTALAFESFGRSSSRWPRIATIPIAAAILINWVLLALFVVNKVPRESAAVSESPRQDGQSMKPLRIGILGCGRIALSTHLPLLSSMRQVALTGGSRAGFPGCDNVRRPWRRAGTASAGLAQRDPRDDVDAVVVCLPSALARRSWRGRFECPQTSLSGETDRLRSAGGQSPDRGMEEERPRRDGGLQLSVQSACHRAEAQIQAARIGRVIAIQSAFCTHAGNLPGWKARRSSGGGVLLDLASHHIDLFRFLLASEMQEVFARVTEVEE